jgi:hypothetical protein
MDQFDMNFDGLSDISFVATDAIDTVAGIIGRRIRSMLKYKAKDKLEPLVNKIISVLPDSITIAGTDVTLEFGLSSNFKITKNDFLQIPLDLGIQSSNYPFPTPYTVTLPEFKSSGH